MSEGCGGCASGRVVLLTGKLASVLSSGRGLSLSSSSSSDMSTSFCHGEPVEMLADSGMPPGLFPPVTGVLLPLLLLNLPAGDPDPALLLLFAEELLRLLLLSTGALIAELLPSARLLLKAVELLKLEKLGISLVFPSVLGEPRRIGVANFLALLAGLDDDKSSSMFVDMSLDCAGSLATSSALVSAPALWGDCCPVVEIDFRFRKESRGSVLSTCGSVLSPLLLDLETAEVDHTVDSEHVPLFKGVMARGPSASSSTQVSQAPRNTSLKMFLELPLQSFPTVADASFLLLILTLCSRLSQSSLSVFSFCTAAVDVTVCVAILLPV